MALTFFFLATAQFLSNIFSNVIIRITINLYYYQQ